MKKRISIGIAGAGIGGLAAACLLADRGHDVTVFDQFDQPRPVGSGLVIQPVGQAVLDRIGARQLARDRGNRIQHMLGIEADSGRKVLNVWYDQNPDGAYGLGIHRASLFDALLQAAISRNIAVHPAHRALSHHNGELRFESGTIAGPFDLVVDASGATSALSPLMSRPLPYGAIWGTVDWPETKLPLTRLSQVYRRADRMIGVLPIGKIPGDDTPKAAVFWSLPSDSHPDWLQSGLAAWRAEATALWPEFAPFAAQITDPVQMTMARYSHGTLRKPWSPGLVHIGDASHRASPQLGQGANMALLDALALTKALDHAEGDDALAIYAQARRWHVGLYQWMSALFTPQYQSDSRWLPVLRDRLLYPVSQVPPGPKVLSAIVRGTMLPPLASLTRD